MIGTQKAHTWLYNERFLDITFLEGELNRWTNIGNIIIIFGLPIIQRYHGWITYKSGGRGTYHKKENK